MGFLSNNDIRYALRNGFIKMNPKPKLIGPMSIDLAIEKVFQLDNNQLEKIFQPLKNPATDINDFFLEGRINLHDIDSMGLQALPKTGKNWCLDAGHFYMVKHREETAIEARIGYNIYTRSTAARRGLHSSGFGYDGKYFYELVDPFITQNLSKLDRISQLVFVEPDTEYLDKSSIEEALSGEHIKIDGKPDAEVKEVPSTRLGFIPLTLADEVKFYDPRHFNQPYSPERLVDSRLSSQSIPKCSFVLGISKEEISVCNAYLGELPHHVHKNSTSDELVTAMEECGLDKCKQHVGNFHSSSPYHQPGSSSHLVFEITKYDPGIISEGMRIPLRIVKMRTVGDIYHGKFSGQNKVIVS